MDAVVALLVETAAARTAVMCVVAAVVVDAAVVEAQTSDEAVAGGVCWSGSSRCQPSQRRGCKTLRL